MKRLVVGILDIVIVLSLLAIGATAAPAAEAAGRVGPYEGTFQGVARGDRGTTAPLMLELTHRGSQVEGDVFLGEGLYVSGGWCGTVNVPAMAQHVEGKTSFTNPKRLVVTPKFEAGGLDIAVDFESNVSSDGKAITAEAKIDLPWFCGRDPVLTARLEKD